MAWGWKKCMLIVDALLRWPSFIFISRADGVLFRHVQKYYSEITKDWTKSALSTIYSPFLERYYSDSIFGSFLKRFCNQYYDFPISGANNTTYRKLGKWHKYLIKTDMVLQDFWRKHLRPKGTKSRIDDWE